MKKLNEEIIINILKNVKDINSNNNIVETGTLSNIIITEKLVSVILIIKNEKNLYANIVNQCKKYLNKVDDSINYNIVLTAEQSAKKENSNNNMKNGIKPEDIAFISYTNAAANEAKKGVSSVFPDLGSIDFPNFSTMHSLATRIGGNMG